MGVAALVQTFHALQLQNASVAFQLKKNGRKDASEENKKMNHRLNTMEDLLARMEDLLKRMEEKMRVMEA